MKSISAPCTEAIATQILDKFTPLREFVTKDDVVKAFIEEGMAKELLDSVIASTEVETLCCLLFTTSDLIDLDYSGGLATWFCDHGLVDRVIQILRKSDTFSLSISLTGASSNSTISNSNPSNLNSSSAQKDTSKLKASCVCVLSGLSSTKMSLVASTMDKREVDLLHHFLQLKSMMPLHSRCIIFINNLYVSSYFAQVISFQFIPSVMTLLMYNVTNHIKLMKKLIQESLAKAASNSVDTTNQINSQSTHLPSEDAKSDREPSTNDNINPTISNDLSTSSNLSESVQTAPHDTVDKMYNDNLYFDFITSASILLGNLTTNRENCITAETYCIIDILTLLFHHSNDHKSPEILTNVVKCLANLAHLEVNRPRLMKSNILSMAIRLLLVGRTILELRAHIVLLLANLTGCNDTNQLIAVPGVIAAIVSFLDEVSGAPVPSIAPTLSHLSSNSASGNGFALSGVKNENYQRFACLAIANLSLDPIATPLLINAGCMERIINLCYSDSMFIQRQAVRALHSFALFNEGEYSADLARCGAEAALSHAINTGIIHTSVIDTENPTNALPTLEALAISTINFIRSSRDSPSIPPLIDATILTEAASSNLAPAFTYYDIESIDRLVEEEKMRGNDHFTAKRWGESITCYSKAIELAPSNEKLYSNRSAAYSHMGNYDLALKDAEVCIRLSRNWVKGHFRRGKALLGLRNYEEAILSLKEALSCEEDNKREIQESLQLAVNRARELQGSYVNSHFYNLNAAAILKLLKEIYANSTPSTVTITLVQTNGSPKSTFEVSFLHTAQLLLRLFTLLKQYYDSNTPSDTKSSLMGDTDPDSVGLELHTWSARVNLKPIVACPGMDFVLFRLDLICPTVHQSAALHPDQEEEWLTTDDLSCYQFGYFVTTILTRLVLEGHNQYGYSAMKRLITLNTDKQVRTSLGSPLTQSVLQITGYGCWGFPKMPWLRSLFLSLHGICSVAIDCFGGERAPACVSFLHSITLDEWRTQQQDQLDSVVELVVLPAFNGEAQGKTLEKVVDIWASVFSMPGTRYNLPHYTKAFKRTEFIGYAISELKSSKIGNQPAVVDPQVPQQSSKQAYELGIRIAKTWIDTKSKTNKR